MLCNCAEILWNKKKYSNAWFPHGRTLILSSTETGPFHLSNKINLVNKQHEIILKKKEGSTLRNVSIPIWWFLQKKRRERNQMQVLSSTDNESRWIKGSRGQAEMEKQFYLCDLMWCLIKEQLFLALISVFSKSQGSYTPSTLRGGTCR